MEYLHGYASYEQQRLIDQAYFWKEKIILPWTDYSKGGKLLDIGCGVGAVLNVIAEAFPEIELNGIDISESQINFAKTFLKDKNHKVGTVQVADAFNLPFEDESFDHVFTMWFLEHLDNKDAALHEAYRVLKPGGTISCIETDYASLKIRPKNEDVQYLFDAQTEVYDKIDDSGTGMNLAPLLLKAGFTDVKNHSKNMYEFKGGDDVALKKHVEYICGFMKDYLKKLAEATGRDFERVKKGYAFFEKLYEKEGAVLTHLVYKGLGVKSF